MDKARFKNAKDFLKDELGKYIKIFLTLFVVIFLSIQAGLFIFQNGFGSTATQNVSFQNVQSKTDGSKSAPTTTNPDGILIPKISVEAPLILVNSTDPKDFRMPLKKGVTHFPSALPGQEGTAIILGHSAPPGWPNINYDGVFSRVQELEEGDEIFVFFNYKEYKYRVSEKVFLKKGQDIPEAKESQSRSRLVLVSCWPPGIDNKRIVVFSELVN